MNNTIFYQSVMNIAAHAMVESINGWVTRGTGQSAVGNRQSAIGNDKVAVPLARLIPVEMPLRHRESRFGLCNHMRLLILGT